MEARDNSEERIVQDVEAGEPSMATPPEDASGKLDFSSGAPSAAEYNQLLQKSGSPANVNERFLWSLEHRKQRLSCVLTQASDSRS